MTKDVYQPLHILPSINVRTFPEVRQRIKLIEPFVTWCHIDVTDGIFSKHKTWRNPADLALLETSLNVEIHLMITEPEEVIDQWLIKPVKRVIIHVEASRDIIGIIEKCRRAGVAIGLAVNPETSWEKLQPWFDKVDMVQVLAVRPGPSGQTMGEAMIQKIIQIKEACSACIIEIDGGVNDETVLKVVHAGARFLVVGKYLFSAPDIKSAVEKLQGATAD